VTPLALRAFYVIGPIFAIWAVVLTVLGIVRPDFPRRIGGERIVIGISAALMLAVILSATIGAKWEHTEQPGSGPEAHGKRGEPTP
jgi:quinol-cytochrome oxidoreductase complex cytochrome b subunit